MPCAVSAGQRAFRPSSSKAANKSPDASPVTMAKRGSMVTSGSAHDAAVRRRLLKEFEHHLHIRRSLGVAFGEARNLGTGHIQRQIAAVQQFVDGAHRRNSLCREATAAQALEIHRAGL